MPWATRAMLARNFSQSIPLPRPDALDVDPVDRRQDAQRTCLNHPRPAAGSWGEAALRRIIHSYMVGCAATRRTRHIHAAARLLVVKKATDQQAVAVASPATRRRERGSMTTRPCALPSSLSTSTVLLGDRTSPFVVGVGSWPSELPCSATPLRRDTMARYYSSVRGIDDA
ncbi:hypothetical protein LY76DRAFT_142083 [Colletotrichum caudatum]|nr:hypothetical protein LY76DRAFT_142083 [Colletotrichum caudatum]